MGYNSESKRQDLKRIKSVEVRGDMMSSPSSNQNSSIAFKRSDSSVSEKSVKSNKSSKFNASNSNFGGSQTLWRKRTYKI